MDDNGGVYFVPAFSGLFAPYWRSDARGVIVGLTRYVNRGHIARATLEATAYQSREVVEAMNADSGVDLESLKVDGGMVHNDLLMQFQADILDVPVIRPAVAETTALGAAYAAGLAVGLLEGGGGPARELGRGQALDAQDGSGEREHGYRYWKKAVTRTFDWVEDESSSDQPRDVTSSSSAAARPAPGWCATPPCGASAPSLVERVDLGQGTTGPLPRPAALRRPLRRRPIPGRPPSAPRRTPILTPHRRRRRSRTPAACS